MKQMLKIAGDTHTHTIACQHAYSTVSENVAYAASVGHRFLAMTDHAPAMPGCPHEWYFQNQQRLPREMQGVVLLSGCELNVMQGGTVDLTDNIIAKLDWVIASMHRGIMPTGLPREDYTAAWLKVAENPYIDCMGHMGHTAFECDYETVIKACLKHGKVVEVNSSSPISRAGCEDNCLQIIRLCKQYGVPMVVSSDAHFCSEIGSVEWASQAIATADYPTEQILNLDYHRMKAWLEKKKGTVLPD